MTRKPGTGITAGRTFVCDHCGHEVQPSDTIARPAGMPKTWYHASCLDDLEAQAVQKIWPANERKSRT